LAVGLIFFLESAFGLFELMGATRIYGRDWGDPDKLDELDWAAMVALFINSLSKLDLI
jgi:hypothetical protein